MDEDFKEYYAEEEKRKPVGGDPLEIITYLLFLLFVGMLLLKISA